MKVSLKNLVVMIFVAAVAVSCSNKKKDAAAGTGDTTGDGSISSQPLSFNVQGSDSGTIKGLRTVNFDYDSSSISGTAKSILAENAKWIKANKDVTVTIEGHTDERGSVEYNLALGERRARAVQQYLVGLGVDSKKMTVLSYGKDKRLDEGDSEAAHAKNRRANFVPVSR
jgi:peptidoglycan-associated lipoprotein